MVKIALIVLTVAGGLGLWQAYAPQKESSHVELTSTTSTLQSTISQVYTTPTPEREHTLAAAEPASRPQSKSPPLVKPPHFLITGIFRDTDEPSQSFAIIETMPGKSITAKIGKRLPGGFQVLAIEQHYVSVEKGDSLFKLSLKHSSKQNNTSHKPNRSANTLSAIANSAYNEPNQRPNQAQNRTRSMQNADHSRRYSTPAPTTTTSAAESVGYLPMFISSIAAPPTSASSELISEPLKTWVRTEKNEPTAVTPQEEETQSSDKLPSFMQAQATGGYELPSFMVGGETEALVENIPSYMRSNIN